jgi:hypothetical protein
MPLIIFSKLDNISRVKKKLKRKGGIWEIRSTFVLWFSKKTSSFNQASQKKLVNIEKRSSTFQVLRPNTSFWRILRIMWLIKIH